MENAFNLYLTKIPALTSNSAVICVFLVGSVFLSKEMEVTDLKVLSDFIQDQSLQS